MVSINLPNKMIPLPVCFNREHSWAIQVFAARPSQKPTMAEPTNSEQILRQNEKDFRAYVLCCLAVCALILLAMVLGSRL